MAREQHRHDIKATERGRKSDHTSQTKREHVEAMLVIPSSLFNGVFWILRT